MDDPSKKRVIIPAGGSHLILPK